MDLIWGQSDYFHHILVIVHFTNYFTMITLHNVVLIMCTVVSQKMQYMSITQLLYIE